MNSNVLWVYFNHSNLTLKELERLYQELGSLKNDFSLKWPEEKLKSFFAGRVALYQILKSQGLNHCITEKTPQGFLQLLDDQKKVVPECFCSISHTESVAVAAFSNLPVGIDIEKRDRTAARGVSKIASESELLGLKKLPPELKTQVADQNLFIWTGKEALFKMMGLGLGSKVHDFEIDFTGAAPFSVKGSGKSPIPVKDPTLSFFTEENFLIAVSAEAGTKIFKSPLLLARFQTDFRSGSQRNV